MTMQSLIKDVTDAATTPVRKQEPSWENGPLGWALLPKPEINTKKIEEVFQRLADKGELKLEAPKPPTTGENIFDKHFVNNPVFGVLPRKETTEEGVVGSIDQAVHNDVIFCKSQSKGTLLAAVRGVTVSSNHSPAQVKDIILETIFQTVL